MRKRKKGQRIITKFRLTELGRRAVKTAEEFTAQLEKIEKEKGEKNINTSFNMG